MHGLASVIPGATELTNCLESKGIKNNLKVDSALRLITGQSLLSTLLEFSHLFLPTKQ